MKSYINQLDHTERFLRCAKLKLNPRHLYLQVLLFSVDAAGTRIHLMQYGNDLVIGHKAHPKFYQNLSQEIELNHRGWGLLVLVSKKGQRRCELLRIRSTGNDFGSPTTSKTDIILRSGISTNKVPLKEWAAYAESPHTLQDWYRFARKIRKHFRKMIIDGTCLASLRKADYLKEATDHDQIKAKLYSQVTEALTRAVSLKQILNGLADNLDPLIKVQPYERWKNRLDYAERLAKSAYSQLENLKDTLEDS